MALPPVAAGDPHAAAHNNERTLINNIQNVTDPTFKDALDAEISSVAPVESVNGQIGDVVLNAANVGAASPADVVAASTEDRKRANHTGTQPAASINDLLEAVQDIIGSSIAAGSNMTMNYNDTTGIITLSAVVDGAAINTDPEVVRDTIGNALVGAGLIGVTVNDAGDTITISTTATQNRTDAATDLLLAAKLDKTKTNGGATGQALVKLSNADQDYGWGSVASGGWDPAAYKGDYAAATAYTKGDTVKVPNTGKVYRAKQDAAGGSHGSVGPTLQTVWQNKAGSGALAATDISVTIPANAIQAGDLILVVSGSHSSGTPTPLAGFTALSPAGQSSSSTTHKFHAFYRIADATDVSAGRTITRNVEAWGDIMVNVFRGVKIGDDGIHYKTSSGNGSWTNQTIGGGAKTATTGNYLEFTATMVYGGSTALTSFTDDPTAGVATFVMTSTLNPYANFRTSVVALAGGQTAFTNRSIQTSSSVEAGVIQLDLVPDALYTLNSSVWEEIPLLTEILDPDEQNLLGKVIRDTSPGASTYYTTSSTTVVPVDSTNLMIAFIAPESGKVKIDLSMCAYVSSAGVVGFVGLCDSGGTYVPGTTQALFGATTPGARLSAHWLIEGLTPGVPYAYQLGAAVSSGSMNMVYGGNTSIATVNTGILGPITMEAWRA